MTDFNLFQPYQIFTVWGDAIEELRRTARTDANFSESDLFARIYSGEFQLWQCEFGWMVTGFRHIKDEGTQIFRIFYVAGSMKMGAEKRLATMRRMMRKFEEIARTGRFGTAIGKKCNEIRFEGRKGWQKALPDYQAEQLDNGNYEYVRRL